MVGDTSATQLCLNELENQTQVCEFGNGLSGERWNHLGYRRIHEGFKGESQTAYTWWDHTFGNALWAKTMPQQSRDGIWLRMWRSVRSCNMLWGVIMNSWQPRDLNHPIQLQSQKQLPALYLWLHFSTQFSTIKYLGRNDLIFIWNLLQFQFCIVIFNLCFNK